MIESIKNEKGIALVEVIAALGIAVIVITSLVSLSIFTLRSSLRSKLLLEGTKIANRELELVRALRDSSDSWDTFLTTVVPCTISSPCSVIISPLGVSYVPFTENEGTTEAITRQFTATIPGGGDLTGTEDTVRISVSVTWSVGGDSKSAFLYTDLTNWRGR